MHCLTTYKDDKEIYPKCIRGLAEIDTAMLDIIFDLNKKGYKTEFCCSGHPTVDNFHAYLIISGEMRDIPVPEGFTVSFRKNITDISSIRSKKGKRQLTTDELEQMIRKNMESLRRWVLKLPSMI
jgi:hypothetical protein